MISGAAFLRSAGVGMASVLLGVYLAQAAYSATQIGVITAAGLAGNIAALIPATFRADRIGRRRILVGLSLLTASGGVAVACASGYGTLAVASFLGLMNGMGRDRGPAFALEQAVLPALVSPARRTWALAQYNLVLDVGHAVGSLAGAVPYFLRSWLGIGSLASYRWAFAGYAILYALAAAVYLCLSTSVEAAPAALPDARHRASLSPASRKVIGRLSALLGLDSLGGGFLGGATVGYWFFRRYGVTELALAPLFFVSRVLNAVSHLGAAVLAARIGLVNTMVFTHVPSNLALMAVPLAPSLGWAAALFLLRESLVEMDVPTRQSYVAAVVAPEERTVASGVTNLCRNVTWAAGPSVGGYAMQHVGLAAPLFIGGAIKIAYDALLYVAFHDVRPLEERRSAAQHEPRP